MPEGIWASMSAWQQRRLVFDAITEPTHNSQLSALRSFAEHYGPDRPPDQAEREDFEDWLAALKSTPTSTGAARKNSSINTMAGPVRTFFADLKARNRIPVDPCREVKKLRTPPSKYKGLSDEEVDALVRCARSFRDKSIIRVARYTGFRVSEVSRMRVEHWTPTQQQMEVVRSKSGIEQEIWAVGELEEVLRCWVAYGLDGATKGPMWPSYKGGGPLAPGSMSRIVRDAAAEAGIEATFHQLRHSFAYAHAQSGVPPHVLQALLGHKSILSAQHYTTPHAVDLYQAMAGQPNVRRVGAADRA